MRTFYNISRNIRKKRPVEKSRADTAAQRLCNLYMCRKIGAEFVQYANKAAVGAAGAFAVENPSEKFNKNKHFEDSVGMAWLFRKKGGIFAPKCYFY